MERNLQRGHNCGYDDEVLGDFIITDEIFSKSNNEHSDREDNDFIVPGHCDEVEGSSSGSSDW